MACRNSDAATIEMFTISFSNPQFAISEGVAFEPNLRLSSKLFGFVPGVGVTVDFKFELWRRFECRICKQTESVML